MWGFHSAPMWPPRQGSKYVWQVKQIFKIRCQDRVLIKNQGGPCTASMSFCKWHFLLWVVLSLQSPWGILLNHLTIHCSCIFFCSSYCSYLCKTACVIVDSPPSVLQASREQDWCVSSSLCFLPQAKSSAYNWLSRNASWKNEWVNE